MKINLIATLFMVFGFGPYALAQKPVMSKPSDKKYEKLILGLWKADYKVGLAKLIGFSNYKSDKSFSAHGKLTVLNTTQSFTTEGTWHIKNGMLIAKVLKSSNSEMLPIGLVTKDKIIVLNKTTYTYKDHEGTIFTDKRMNQP